MEKNELHLPIPENGIITLITEHDVRFSGRVLYADRDFVILKPQGYVAKNSYDERWGCTEIDRTVTVDLLNEIRVDRSRIIAWSWFTPLEVSEKTTFYGIPQPEELKDLTCNIYGSDGFFRGSGSYR